MAIPYRIKSINHDLQTIFIHFLLLIKVITNPCEKYGKLKSKYHLLCQFPEITSVNIMLNFLPGIDTYEYFILRTY